MAQLDAEAVRAAYRRQAAIYDVLFGRVSKQARKRAIDLANALPGREVLEVGVGTGLALPHYSADKRVTGIDLSADMLARARQRVVDMGLSHVEALLELDAEATGLPAARFDVAAVMFVASVVPDPRRLLAELKRLVRPGGSILFVNHFIASGGPRLLIERAMAPLSHAIGWHPDFAKSDLFDAEDLRLARFEPMPPFGIFTLVHLKR
jgi:phosphatidylethanolamine/phosphatidyl-N-methylethanolamine N-methyltransferase